MRIAFVAAILSMLATTAVAAETQSSITVDQIVARGNHAALYQGADSQGKASMVITDKQGRTRKRAFTMLRKDVGAVDGDQRYYAYFQAPADVRKMVFMVHKKAALETEDDRWLYMPGLDLVKRIAAGDKRTSFVGSDFLYEDISGRSPAEDHHELIETTAEHYLVKNTPKKPDSVEFAYYLAHIDKTTFVPMKMVFFKAGDQPYREIEVLRVENVEAEENGQAVIYPTTTEMVARDLVSRSETKMTMTRVRYNLGLDDDLFSERYLRRPPRHVLR